MSDLTYALLQRALTKPAPWSAYTADTLWTDPHISAQMLRYHLDPQSEPASRRHAFVARSAAWVAGRFDLGAGRRVVDLGCGPGLYANVWAQRGAAVTGVDFSSRSLDHARSAAHRLGLEPDYVEANYLDWQPAGPVDLVTLIYCDLCALSPPQRQRLLAAVRDGLAPGGHVLLDVCALAALQTRTDSVRIEPRLDDGFWAPGEYVGIAHACRYDVEDLTLDHYTIVEPARSWEVYNWLQHYDPDGLRAELAQAGLRVIEVLGDVAGAPYDEGAPQFAVIAGAA